MNIFFQDLTNLRIFSRLIKRIRSLLKSWNYCCHKVLQYCGPFFMPSNFFSPIYAICWFHIFTFFREISKFQNHSILKFCACHPCNQCVVLLFVIELLIYCKKYFLTKQNKNYWYLSIDQQGFDVALKKLKLPWKNIDTTLYRRCAILFWHCFNVVLQRCINVVQRWKSEVGFYFTFEV